MFWFGFLSFVFAVENRCLRLPQLQLKFSFLLKLWNNYFVVKLGQWRLFIFESLGSCKIKTDHKKNQLKSSNVASSFIRIDFSINISRYNLQTSVRGAKDVTKAVEREKSSTFFHSCKHFEPQWWSAWWDMPIGAGMIFGITNHLLIPFKDHPIQQNSCLVL